MMDLSQELIDRIHQNLIDVGMKIEKADLQRHLLKPGEERLQLIKWALSEFGIIVKNESDIPEVVIGMGLCPSNRAEIVLGNCSARDSLQFWTRLFQMVHVHKSTNSDRAQSSYENNCQFWLRLSSSSELRNLMQQKKKKEQTPKNISSNSKINELQEELAKQRLIELKELEEMEKENALENKEDCAEKLNFNLCDSDEVSGEEEVREVKLLASRFEQELLTLWMPWMSDEVKDSHHEEFNKFIPEIDEKMRKLKLFCENAQKIVTAVEKIKNAELDEPSTGDFKLPNLHM